MLLEALGGRLKMLYGLQEAKEQCMKMQPPLTSQVECSIGLSTPVSPGKTSSIFTCDN